MHKKHKKKDPLIENRVSQSWLNSITTEEYNYLINLSMHCSLMYNFALYQIRQSYFKNQNLKFKDNYYICKNNENFSILLNDCSNQTVQLAHRDFNSFIGLLSAKNNGTYNKDVRIPRYKKKNKQTILSNIVIQGKGIRINKKKSQLFDDFNIYNVNASKTFKLLYPEVAHQLEIKVPKHITKINEIRIIPTGIAPVKFKLEVVYSVKVEQKKENNNNYLSIDPGLNNLAACFNSNNGSSFIIDGRYLKSINQHYNKKSSKLQSSIDIRKNENLDPIDLIKKKNRVNRNRNNKINDYFHRASKYIVEYCVKNNINKIIIGENKEQKQNINIGKINNQNFVFIPHAKFKDILEYKARTKGIELLREEESYTSKTSFIDLEPMKHQDTYLGKRTNRGIFRTKEGLLINSDINGAANILRKYLERNGKFKEWFNLYFKEASKGIVNYPRKLNLDKLLSEFGFKKTNA